MTSCDILNSNLIMIDREKGPVIVVPGGGSGPLTFEDALLDLTPNVISLATVTDNGGHTKEVRSVLGVSAPGDIINRMAVHIRDNARFRSIFLHRFSENGNKALNFLVAAAEKETGSISEGVKIIESELKDYKGRVIPISDENIHLRAYLENGEVIDGEENFDTLALGSSPIVDIDFTKKVVKDPPLYMPIMPKTNEEALYFLRNSDANVIPPGSWRASIMAVLKHPGAADAIRQSRAPLIQVVNAAWSPETPYWDASHYARDLRDVIGRRIDCIIVNTPDHHFPASYRKESKFPVNPNLDEVALYADEVFKGAFTRVEDINGIPTVRHKGIEVAEIVMDIIKNAAPNRLVTV